MSSPNEEEIKKDTETVKAAYATQMTSFCPDLIPDESRVVADGFIVNQNAFAELFVYCAQHRLNLVTVLFWLLMIRSYSSLDSTYKACKAVIAYIKRTGKMEDLKFKLMSECITRFNTRVISMRSVHRNINSLESLCSSNKKALYCFKRIKMNKTKMELIISFLEEVEACSKSLSPGKRPTLHEVLDSMIF